MNTGILEIALDLQRQALAEVGNADLYNLFHEAAVAALDANDVPVRLAEVV